MQIIKPNVFLNIRSKVFSMTKIWNSLIEEGTLNALESNTDFIHVSTLDIYNKIIKNLNVK